MGLLLAGACSHKKSGPGSASSKTTQVTSLPTQAKTLKLVASGKLTACIASADPPFAFDDAGRTAGIDAELIRALGGRMGLQADFVPGPASSVVDSLKAGKCDVAAAGIAIADTLRQQVDLSPPYLPLGPAIVVKKADTQTYAAPSALRGKSVAVVTGSPAAPDVDRAAKANGFTTTPFADLDKALAAVKAGTVVAAAVELAPAAYKVKGSSDLAVSAVIRDQQGGGYGVASKKGDTLLSSQLASALSQVKADDTYRNVLAPSLGDAANLVIG